jgi:hypothetical protein
MGTQIGFMTCQIIQKSSPIQHGETYARNAPDQRPHSGQCTFKLPLPHVLPFESVCTLRCLRQTLFHRRSFQSWLLPPRSRPLGHQLAQQRPDLQGEEFVSVLLIEKLRCNRAKTLKKRPLGFKFRQSHCCYLELNKPQPVCQSDNIFSERFFSRINNNNQHFR